MKKFWQPSTAPARAEAVANESKMTGPDPFVDIAKGAIIAAGTVSALVGFGWAIWIVRAFRRDKRRIENGLCLRCGYDLRQSVERCPECGEPIRPEIRRKPRAK